MCYGPLAIHTVCKYGFICATLYDLFVLVHNTSENTILFFFLFFLAIFDLQRTLFEQCGVFFYFLWRKKKKKRKKEDLLFPLHCDGELTQRLFEMSAGTNTDSGSDLNITIPPSWQASRQTCGPMARRSKGRLSAKIPPHNLWLTVAYFDPLSDE